MNIIIIGATSGIGKALFLNYVKRDHSIGIVGRRTHLLEELRQQYPFNTKAVTADITKLEESGSAINSIHEAFGQIDLAIVCAGTGELNPSLDYSIERLAIDTNVIGWTFVVDTLYRLFEQQGKCVYILEFAPFHKTDMVEQASYKHFVACVGVVVSLATKPVFAHVIIGVHAELHDDGIFATMMPVDRILQNVVIGMGFQTCHENGQRVLTNEIITVDECNVFALCHFDAGITG